MNENAKQILDSSTFVPTIIHGSELDEISVQTRATTLETLQITLAFIIGSALTLFTMLL